MLDWEQIPRLDGSESLGMKPSSQHEKHSIISLDHCAVMVPIWPVKWNNITPLFPELSLGLIGLQFADSCFGLFFGTAFFFFALTAV